MKKLLYFAAAWVLASCSAPAPRYASRADACAKIFAQGSKVWVNTIWASLCGGDDNDDDAAFQSEDPGQVYQQYLDAGVSMIQTDRPELLIGWLQSQGRHTLR